VSAYLGSTNCRNAAEFDHVEGDGAPQARSQGHKYEYRMALKRAEFW
jgi:hypothetical protein